METAVRHHRAGRLAQAEERIAEMRQGLIDSRAIGAGVRRSYFLALLAEACGHTTKRLVKTASATQVRQPIYGKAVDGWKRYARHPGRGGSGVFWRFGLFSGPAPRRHARRWPPRPTPGPGTPS